MDVSKENELIDLGIVVEETKGLPIVGEPDEAQLQRFGTSISED